MSAPTRFEARGVSYSYPGPLRAVEDASFTLSTGEWMTMIGPNGSGKSTLLRVAAGLLKPDRGIVTLGGRDLHELTPRERAREVALLPQFLPTMPDVRVGDFVLAGRYAHVAGHGELASNDRAVVERALEQCDAADLVDRAVRELSGGQRQRVLFARALAQEARVLFVDEPTSALDPEHAIAVCELLGRLVASGHAVLVVTHDLVLAAQYATRLVLLDHGRVVRDGDVDDVLRPEVLEPVYGRDLSYSRFENADGVERPLVLARRAGSPDASKRTGRPSPTGS